LWVQKKKIQTSGFQERTSIHRAPRAITSRARFSRQPQIPAQGQCAYAATRNLNENRFPRNTEKTGKKHVMIPNVAKNRYYLHTGSGATTMRYIGNVRNGHIETPIRTGKKQKKKKIEKKKKSKKKNKKKKKNQRSYRRPPEQFRDACLGAGDINGLVRANKLDLRRRPPAPAFQNHQRKKKKMPRGIHTKNFFAITARHNHLTDRPAPPAFRDWNVDFRAAIRFSFPRAKRAAAGCVETQKSKTAPSCKPKFNKPPTCAGKQHAKGPAPKHQQHVQKQAVLSLKTREKRTAPPVYRESML